jgi:hypothetical protein
MQSCFLIRHYINPISAFKAILYIFMNLFKADVSFFSIFVHNLFKMGLTRRVSIAYTVLKLAEALSGVVTMKALFY